MHSTRLNTPNHMRTAREQTPNHVRLTLEQLSQAPQKHCVCECPRRPENEGVVVVKSRSLSPRLKRSLRRKSGRTKPPFKTGKADETIISRRDFPPSPRNKHRDEIRNSLPSTPVPAEGDPCKCCLAFGPQNVKSRKKVGHAMCKSYLVIKFIFS